MKMRKQFEKWGKIALAGLCALLVFRLVSEIKGNPATPDEPEQMAYRPSSNPASTGKTAPGKGNASLKFDPIHQMEVLQEYVTRRLPDIRRNPFDFGPPPLTPAQRAAQAASAAAAAAAASSAGAPGGIPLRAIGYSERMGVGPEAYLTDADQVYVVHDGDVISQRYKIVKITSMIVEIMDGVSGEKSGLPIPMVQ